MDVLVVRAQSLKSREFTVSASYMIMWDDKLNLFLRAQKVQKWAEVFQKCAVCPQGTRFCLQQAVAEVPSPVPATCLLFSTSAGLCRQQLAACARSLTIPPQRAELGFWLNDFGPVFGFHRLLLRSAGAEVEQLPQWWKSFHINQRRGRWDFSVITSP